MIDEEHPHNKYGQKDMIPSVTTALLCWLFALHHQICVQGGCSRHFYKSELASNRIKRVGGENKYQKEDAERNLQQSGIAIPAAATGL